MSQQISSISASNKPKQQNKEVNYVNIKLKSTVNVLLWAQLVAPVLTTNHHLSVKNEKLKIEDNTFRDRLTGSNQSDYDSITE